MGQLIGISADALSRNEFAEITAAFQRLSAADQLRGRAMFLIGKAGLLSQRLQVPNDVTSFRRDNLFHSDEFKEFESSRSRCSCEISGR